MVKRHQRHTKIVATLGPASSSEETIRALFDAGVSVFRFSFSHGSHEDHQARYDIVRKIEKNARRPIAVLADLQGPKLRIGRLADGPLLLVRGETLRLDLDPTPGTRARVPLPHPEVFAVLKSGMQLLVDDGKMRFEVASASEGFAIVRVSVGGMLSERKGVSVGGAILPLSAMTEKDRGDLAFALQMGADWIALSFVQRPEDLDELRLLAGRPISVMTKLEKPTAVKRLDEIVAHSDAIMIARGDLGVEMAPQKVPTVQRRVLRACRRAGKPVIVATQMLESMIATPMPTRAEASDVATAVYEGADAVMLSAETASGKYPVEAVKMMNDIITEVEDDGHYREILDAALPDPEPTVSDVICDALRKSVSVLQVAALVTYTAAGKTALRAARERPGAPILGLTPDLATARRLALVWGVYPVVTTGVKELSEIVDAALMISQREGFAGPGDTIALTGGMPFGVSGGTNLLRFVQLPLD